jgi:hypothetical protein
MGEWARIVFAATAAINVLLVGISAWRVWQLKRTVRALEGQQRRQMTSIAALHIEEAPMVQGPFTLRPHPRTSQSEVQDALRFGFAAAQKYLDELGAEYGVRGDG